MFVESDILESSSLDGCAIIGMSSRSTISRFVVADCVGSNIKLNCLLSVSISCGYKLEGSYAGNSGGLADGVALWSEILLGPATSSEYVSSVRIPSRSRMWWVSGFLSAPSGRGSPGHGSPLWAIW